MLTKEVEQAENRDVIFEKEAKYAATTITNTKVPSEQPNEPAILDPRYQGPAQVPELAQDQRLAEIDSPQQPSPTPAYSKFAAPCLQKSTLTPQQNIQCRIIGLQK